MHHRLTIHAFYILAICLLGFLPGVKAAPGDLDPTFSGDGVMLDSISPTSTSDEGRAAFLQPDGKLVVAGNFFGRDCAIARYNPDGSLDTTFDIDGKVVTEFDPTLGSSFQCNAVAVGADRKIVIAGSAGANQAADFVLMRFNADGSLDTTFDGDGKVRTTIAAGTYDVANALAIQTDGKIVAAGVSNPGSASNFALIRYNADGSLDTSFDGDGKVLTDIAFSLDVAYAMAIQPDGKIVAAGYSYANGEDFALARYNTDGSLDTTFSDDGKLITDFGGVIERVNELAIQADGKIVAAGSTYNNTPSGDDFALARYNTDGTLDASFDGDGKVITNFQNSNDTAYAVAIQADGKIVAAGTNYNGGTDFALIRYNTDGSLDTSFGAGGKVTTNVLFEDYAYAMAIRPDGKIVAAGNTDGSQQDFAVVSYNPDGSLDNSFGAGGKVTTDIGIMRNAVARATAVQPDGKIITAGWVDNSSNNDILVIRYNTDGTRDSTFGNGGIVITTISTGNTSEIANAVVIQPDGKIVVAGYANISGSQDFALVRYNPNGTLDTSFDGDGKVTTPITATSSDSVNALALQPDGKIVAAGAHYNGTKNVTTVVRYNSDGSLDASFDGDGKLVADFPNIRNIANAVGIQPNGKIVTAGYSSSGLEVLRLNTDGSFDTTFNGSGVARTFDFGTDDFARSLAIQPDGKILAAGRASNNSGSDFLIVRYNPDGTLDPTFDGDGKLTTDISGSQDELGAIALQANGKILAAGNCGSSASPFVPDAAIVRYNPDGSLDGSFGTGGKRTFDFFNRNSDSIYAMALDSTGKAVLAGVTKNSIAVARVLTGEIAPPNNTPFDFDGDGKSDVSIFRPSTGEWWISKSSNGGNFVNTFGNSADKLTPADYTGDGKTDVAFFRPSTGEWFILRSNDGSYYSVPFGTTGDVPVPADYDGDGIADLAVFRPSSSTWYINKSSGGTSILTFGTSGDAPVPADYDGDGKADIAIWRASAGEWWIARSTAGLIAFGFGTSTDKPVPGDYTGDGIADTALFRPSTGEWLILRSENRSFYSFPFGTLGDVPAPGDYDGDGKFDAAVFRPSNSTWFVQRSTAGIMIQTFGIPDDRPVPNAFVP